jgi:hypothetical protein
VTGALPLRPQDLTLLGRLILEHGAAITAPRVRTRASAQVASLRRPILCASVSMVAKYSIVQFWVAGLSFSDVRVRVRRCGS